jgi:hypothetical protein
MKLIVSIETICIDPVIHRRLCPDVLTHLLYRRESNLAISSSQSKIIMNSFLLGVLLSWETYTYNKLSSSAPGLSMM